MRRAPLPGLVAVRAPAGSSHGPAPAIQLAGVAAAASAASVGVFAGRVPQARAFGGVGVSTAAEARAEVTKGGSSLGTSMLNLSKNIIGAGMLSLPFAMKGAGVVPFLIGITFMGILNAYTFFLLGWCCRATGARSFGELWSKTFGQQSAWLADLSVMLNNGLACLAYCVLTGDFLSKALAGLLPGLPFLHARGADLGLVAVMLLIPLSLLKDMAPLRFSSLAGLAATLYGFSLVVGGCANMGGIFDLAGPVQKNIFPLRVDFFASLALFSSAFMAHYNSPKFYADLQDNSLPRFGKLVLGAFGLALVVFTAFGFSGFALFGFDVEGNVLKNYGGGTQVMLAWLGMAFSVVFTYPLVFSTFRESSTSFFNRLGFLSDPASPNFRLAFTVVAVALTAAGGSVLSNIALVNGIKGAVLSSCLAFIYPAAIHLKLSSGAEAQRDPSTRPMRFGSYFLIGVGVCAGVLALLAMFVLPKTDFSALAAATAGRATG